MAIYKKTLKNTNKNTSETILFDGSSNTGADSAIITTGGGLGKITVADGSNIYNLNSTKDAQSFTGGKGADSFVIKVNKLAGVTIDGGTSTQLAYNGTTGAFTSVADDAAKNVFAYTGSLASQANIFSDTKLQVAGRPGATTNFNQSTSILDESSLKDGITFTKSGNFSTGLKFTNIEKINVSSGVQITLTATQLKENFASLDKGAINPGLHFYGVPGGKEEVVHALMWSDAVAAGDNDGDDEPVGLVDPAVGRSYYSADLQLDDFTIANVLHNLTLVYQGRSGTGLLPNSYVRVDGCNDTERGFGAEGADYATMRLGNDVYYGYGGNDYLVGHGGNDQLYGGSGNDMFVVGSFGSGIPGTSSKGDDDQKEWIATGGTKQTDHDFIDGGTGTDTLRVTTGIGAVDSSTGKLELLDSNIVNIERVEVGGFVSRDPDESQYQYMTDEHWYLNKSGTVADTTAALGGKYIDANSNGSFDAGETLNSINFVVVDASRVTKKGLTFEGNANKKTFLGTSMADIFIGNGGQDLFTGNAGADQFVFQTVRTYARDDSTANGVIGYTYADTALTSTDADTITDFVSGTDKFVFRVEALKTLEDTFSTLPELFALKVSELSDTNVYIADIAAGAINTSGTATSFIKADTTGDNIKVYYDSDGSGPNLSVLIATLTNVSSVVPTDFKVDSVFNF